MNLEKDPKPLGGKSLGGEPQPDERIIGENTLGITLPSIQKLINELREEVQEVDKQLSLTEGDFQKQFPSEDVAKQTLKIFRHIKQRNEAILSSQPEEILRSLQEVFDFTHKLEKEGLDRITIAIRIKKERPDLAEVIKKYYSVLRTQHWGYYLGQSVIV